MSYLRVKKLSNYFKWMPISQLEVVLCLLRQRNFISIKIQLFLLRTPTGAPDEYTYSHCIEREKSDPKFSKLIEEDLNQNCLAVDKERTDAFFQGEVSDLLQMLGVDSLAEIDHLESASKFSVALIQLEELAATEENLNKAFEIYEAAADFRKEMAGNLIDSPRWNDVQIEIFNRLKTRVMERDDPADIKRELLQKFSKLYYEASGPKNIESGLKDLILLFGTSREKMEICERIGDNECVRLFGRLADEELLVRHRRPDLTSNVYFDEPRRKKYLLATGVGSSILLRDGRHFLPAAGVYLMAQMPGLVRGTLAVDVGPDYRENVTVKSGTPYLTRMSGFRISPSFILGLDPWGMGASIDLGVRGEYLDGTKLYAQRYDSKWVRLKESLVEDFSWWFDAGVTILPRDSVSIKIMISAPLEEEGVIPTAIFGLSLNHFIAGL